MSSSKGGCFAIANESSPCSGIYFDQKEAIAKIREMRSRGTHGNDSNSHSDPFFLRFDKVRDAESYLKDRGFEPSVQNGGWISAKTKDPILYKPKEKTIHRNQESFTAISETTVTSSDSRIGMAHVTPLHTPGMPLTRSPYFSSTQSQHRSATATYGDSNQKENHSRDQLWSNHEHGVQSRHTGGNDTSSRNNVISIDSSPESSSGTSTKKKHFAIFDAQQRNSGSGSGPPPSAQKRERKPRRRRERKPRVRGHSREKRQRRDPEPDENDPPGKSQPKTASTKIASYFSNLPDFDEVQQEAVDAAMAGKNVFLTGVAGTGKSLVTKKIVEDAKNLGKEVAVAAPTGVAAVNLGPELGAQTVHSLAGVGVPQTASGFDKMTAPWVAKKWKKIEVLVLDEIGMLGADFLDWMDVYVRKVRRKPLDVFGGIQLIFVGDFAQLGPIPGRQVSLKNDAIPPDQPGADCLLDIFECAAYAFQTVMWREANFHHVHLRKVYRQKNIDFQLALMDIREAKPESQRARNLVDTCSTPLENRERLEIPEGIKPTILYCTNQNVDKENFENLARLPDKGKVFEASDSTSISGDVTESGRDFVGRMLTNNAFFKDCSASKKIHLKVGAQVMLLQNLDIKEGLVNGSRGVVESFKLCPVVKDVLTGKEERLIGPSDVADKFPGRRFEDLKFGDQADFDGKIWRICRMDRYPLVRFVNNSSRIIVPETFERTLYRQGRCMRKQIPLRLAWALTIHKSQGATLDYVVCDLQGCFTSGQAYVALSRARSMLGLQIKNFSSRHVTADPLVEAFYDALDRHDMNSFLEEQAGIWWFPILKAPDWLLMFQNASYKNAKSNSEQFRSWLADYRPIDGYTGWGA